MIFFITGESGSGKTTLMKALAARLVHRGVVAGGFLAPGKWNQGRRSGFDLLNLLTQEESPLASLNFQGGIQQGPFSFNEDTLKRGTQLLLQHADNQSVEILFVDEVGPLELRGGGWAKALMVLSDSQKPQVWSVRPGIIQEVADQWNFNPAQVFQVAEVNPADIETHIIQYCPWLNR